MAAPLLICQKPIEVIWKPRTDYKIQVSEDMLQLYISGLKGHQALSAGHRPGDKCSGIFALKGQKLSCVSAFALTGRSFHDVPQYPGRCPGLLAFRPFRPYLCTCIMSFRNLNYKILLI